MKYQAELRPMYRLVKDHPPPLGAKLILLNEYGQAVLGHYYPKAFVAWCPLPKLTAEQKEKLK